MQKLVIAFAIGCAPTARAKVEEPMKVSPSLAPHAVSRLEQCTALIPPQLRRGLVLEPAAELGALRCTARLDGIFAFDATFGCERGRTPADFRHEHDSVSDVVKVGRSAHESAHSIALYAHGVDCEVKVVVRDTAHYDLLELARAIDAALTPETVPWPNARIAPRCDVLVPAAARARLGLTTRIDQRAVNDELVCAYVPSDHKHRLAARFDCAPDAADRFRRAHPAGQAEVTVGVAAVIDTDGGKLDFLDHETGCWVEITNGSDTDPRAPETIALATDIEVALTRAAITPSADPPPPRPAEVAGRWSQRWHDARACLLGAPAVRDALDALDARALAGKASDCAAPRAALVVEDMPLDDRVLDAAWSQLPRALARLALAGDDRYALAGAITRLDEIDDALVRAAQLPRDVFVDPVPLVLGPAIAGTAGTDVRSSRTDAHVLATVLARGEQSSTLIATDADHVRIDPVGSAVRSLTDHAWGVAQGAGGIVVGAVDARGELAPGAVVAIVDPTPAAWFEALGSGKDRAVVAQLAAPDRLALARSHDGGAHWEVPTILVSAETYDIATEALDVLWTSDPQAPVSWLHVADAVGPPITREVPRGVATCASGGVLWTAKPDSLVWVDATTTGTVSLPANHAAKDLLTCSRDAALVKANDELTACTRTRCDAVPAPAITGSTQAGDIRADGFVVIQQLDRIVAIRQRSDTSPRLLRVPDGAAVVDVVSWSAGPVLVVRAADGIHFAAVPR